MTTRGVVLALILALVPSALVGQARGVDRQQLESRIRQAFQNQIRQQLELSPGETSELTEVVQWSEGQRRQIAERTRQLNDGVVNFLRDGGTEADARAILGERRALQREESELFAEEQDRLLGVLSPNQVVRFYRLRDQFNRRLQQVRARRAGNGNDP